MSIIGSILTAPFELFAGIFNAIVSVVSGIVMTFVDFIGGSFLVAFAILALVALGIASTGHKLVIDQKAVER